MVDYRVKNIRKLPTNELKTYGKAYKLGQIYKFAYIEARKELRRRKIGKPVRKKRKRRDYGFGFNFWD